MILGLRQLDLLLYVRDGRTIPYITRKIGARSTKTAFDGLKELEELGLIAKIKNENGKTKIGGRELTTLGKETLKAHGHTVERIEDYVISDPGKGTGRAGTSRLQVESSSPKSTQEIISPAAQKVPTVEGQKDPVGNPDGDDRNVN
jgi:DNA-binding HxlR family transcriptional regulator